MQDHNKRKLDAYLQPDDSDADAFAVLSVLLIIAVTVVYYFTG